LHNLHLLADALLEEAKLGKVENQTSSRVLGSQAGTILQGREFMLLYRPGGSECVDWFATAAHLSGITVFYQNFSAEDKSVRGVNLESDKRSFYVFDFVAVDEQHVLALRGSRLTCDVAKGQQYPFGQPVEKVPMRDWGLEGRW
jgi:hypothetical protein